MRRFYRLAFALSMTVLAGAHLSASVYAQSSNQPNVVIIMADDLGFADAGFNGGKIDTPAIDGLVSSGVALERFYVAPLGAPTRAGLMTGRDPIRLGVAYSELYAWDNLGVHPAEHFMSQSFQQAGYQTAVIGAWGLGHAQETFHPNQRGFDEFWGQLLSGSTLNAPYHNTGGIDLQRNGKRVDVTGYLPTLLGDVAVNYIQTRDPEKPFFLLMPFNSAGAKDIAPAALMAKYKRRSADSVSLDPAQQIARAAYAASIDAMDQSIARVLQTLEAQGLKDNTLILFLSDNGGAVGRKGSADNGTLAGGRGETLEGGIHVPAALVWPKQLSPGEFSDTVTMLDVFPTLAAAASVETKNIRTLDGLNLWSAIREGKRVSREAPVMFASEASQYGHFDLTAFDDEWKLVQKVKQDLIYIEVENQLFRVSEGVDETQNLAVQYPDVVEGFSKALNKWRAQHPITGLRNNMVPPPGWRGPIDWAEYPLALTMLQDKTAAGVPPPVARRPLDYQLGEKGRLIYDCQQKWWTFGLCVTEVDEDIKVYKEHQK
jgi:arylsulfatase A-like enzyme